MQTPITTYLLALICVLVTAASLTGHTIHLPFWQRIGSVGEASTEDVWSGHYSSLLMTVFRHADILHLVFNLYWLILLGRFMERSLPVWAYVGFLAASAVVGSATEIIVSGSTGIGASGVVYAMMGLMWAGRGRYPEWRAVATNDNLRLFVLWGLFCVGATYFHLLSIANGAHGGGFVFGAAIGWLCVAPRRQWVWAGALAALLVLDALALFWMPWSDGWTYWKAGQEMDKSHFRSAIGWYQRNLARGGDAHDDWRNIGIAWEGLSAQEMDRHNANGAKAASLEAAKAYQTAGPEVPDTP